MPFISANEFYEDNPSGPVRELRERWQKLAVSPSQVDPACSAPSWNLAFHKTFNPANRVFYQLEDESLVIFTEHMTTDGGFYLGPVEDSWMFARPVLGSRVFGAFYLAINEWRKEYGAQLPPILLSGMAEDDLSCVKLFLGFRKSFNFYRTNSMAECCASLRGGVDGWLSRRSANHRAKLKKAAKKANAVGVEFERLRPRSREEAAKLYERMLGVERRSWKGIDHCGMAESPSREFYSELIGRQALNGDVLLIFARLDGEDAGFIYGGLCGPYYRGQQFSYVNDMAHLSLGNLMQWEKIKWLCELGAQRYDMGPITGPRMGYKSHWTEIQKESHVWLMQQI